MKIYSSKADWTARSRKWKKNYFIESSAAFKSPRNGAPAEVRRASRDSEPTRAINPNKCEMRKGAIGGKARNDNDGHDVDDDEEVEAATKSQVISN